MALMKKLSFVGLLCFGIAGYVAVFPLWPYEDNYMGITPLDRALFVVTLSAWGLVLPLIAQRRATTIIVGSLAGFFSFWILFVALRIESYILRSGPAPTLGEVLLSIVAFPIVAFHPYLFLGMTLESIAVGFLGTISFLGGKWLVNLRKGMT